MAYSAQTGLVYIPVQRAYFPFVEDENYSPKPIGYNLGVHLGAPITYYKEHPKEPSDFVGFVKAIDPVSGKEAWRGEENQARPAARSRPRVDSCSEVVAAVRSSARTMRAPVRSSGA